MKIRLLFCGCLLVALGEHVVQGQYWQPYFPAFDFQHLQEQIQANVQQSIYYAKSQQDRFNKYLEYLRAKCAKKGFSKVGGSINYIVQEVNGIQHIYEQAIDPISNKAVGRYYSFNRNNPNAEPVCGYLVVN